MITHGTFFLPANRFFIPLPLKNLPSISLEGEEFHHLHQVMRVQTNEQVELTNGEGELVKATVVSIAKKKAILIPYKYEKMAPPQETLILAQAIPRLKILEWIIEKGTELGVSEFHLFPGERSEKKELSLEQLNRLKKITIMALKQSGNLFLPLISILPNLTSLNNFSGSLFYGNQSGVTVFTHPPTLKKVTFFNGPEKGFSSNEIDHFRYLKVTPLSLHNNILKSETAAITALGQLFLTLRLK